MPFMDEVKKRAGRARFEADRAMRANRAKSRLTGLQSQLDGSATKLGHQVYELHTRGEIELPALAELLGQMTEMSSHIATAVDELHAIQAETFTVESPGPLCGACGSTNDVDARFCHNCGAPIPVDQGSHAGQAAAGATIACSACGAANPTSMRFCQTCGSALPPASAQPIQPVQHASEPPVAAPASQQDGQRQEPVLETEPDTASESHTGVPVAESASPAAPEPVGAGPIAYDGSPEAHGGEPQPAVAASPRRCAACGENLPEHAAFCAFCGHPAAPEA